MSKLKLIPISEVPPPRSQITKWNELFSAVPPGKAAIIDKIKANTIRLALSHRKKKGEFLNLKFHQRNKIGYLANMEKNKNDS